MRQRGEASALDGEDLERGQADAVQAVGGPAVAAVGVGEGGRVGGPGALAVEEVVHLDAARRGALQRAQHAGEHGRGGGAHGGVRERSSPAALSDHGISSASSSIQSVASSSHRPASPAAVRSRSRISSVTDASSRKGRPVRV